MKRFLICLAMTSGLLLAQAPRTPAPEPLWPSGAPGAQGSEDIDIPTLAAYPAPEGRGVEHGRHRLPRRRLSAPLHG